MDDDSSVDTHDALMEMLGLDTGLGDSFHIQDEDDIENTERKDQRRKCNCANSSLIRLPSQCSKHQLHPDDCFAIVIDDICSEDECQTIVNMATNRFQYITEATHVTENGEKYLVQIQNPNPHKLSVIDTTHHPKTLDSNKDLQTKFMDSLYHKIQSTIQSHPHYQRFMKRTQCGPMRGLNPRMRVLKYDSCDNDRFESHFDATTYVQGQHDSTRRQSLITVLLYLNNGDGEDFQGGETIFLDHCVSGVNKKEHLDSATMVVPKIGRVCLFEHDLFHSGASPSNGTKYIMRTDILFDEIIHENICDGQKNECDTHEVKKESILVSDICAELEFQEKYIDILHELNLFSISCESLLSPGITLLRQMLVDCGIDTDTVYRFTARALDVIKSR